MNVFDSKRLERDVRGLLVEPYGQSDNWLMNRFLLCFWGFDAFAQNVVGNFIDLSKKVAYFEVWKLSITLLLYGYLQSKPQ